MIQSVEKNLLQKTWKVCSHEKITKVSKTTLYNKLFLSKGMFLGVLLRTATMLLFSIEQETVKISSASNAKKNIVWIANLMHTKGSRVKNLRGTVIQTCLTKPSKVLWRGLSSSSAQSAQCGSKRLRAVTTWDADAAPNSVTYAVATIWDALVSTEDVPPVR